LSADSVGLGHHFFYDGATPLHPKCSNALFILQGCQRFPHPTAFLLDDILAGPALKTGFKVPNLAAFSPDEIRIYTRDWRDCSRESQNPNLGQCASQSDSPDKDSLI
jgi:hypothetical protein